MRKFRWLLLPAALAWLTGYVSPPLEQCLTETTADCALEQAIAAAGEIEDTRRRAAALAYVARVQAGTGREADAKSTIERVLFLKRDIMDPSSHDRIASDLVRAHALLGDIDSALEILKGIGDPGRVTLAYAWIAQNQARMGDRAGADKSVAQGLAVAEDLPRDKLAYPFAQMALALAYGNDREEALAVADSALALSSRFSSDLAAARVAGTVAVAQSVAGAPEKAERSLGLVAERFAALEAAGEPMNISGSALTYLVWAASLTGDRDEALIRLEELKRYIRQNPDIYWRSIFLSVTALVLTTTN